MDNAKITLPSYAKYFFVISNIILTLFVIVTASFIINPMLAALIITILLKPLCQKLEQCNIPRIFSSILTVILFILIATCLLSFIVAQLSFISEDPALSTDALNKVVKSVQTGVTTLFGIPLHAQTKFLNESLNNVFKSMIAYSPSAFSVTVDYLTGILLFFISLFFFMYYRDFLLKFLFKILGEKNNGKVEDTFNKIEEAIKNYIVGLFTVIIVVTILNSIGLLLLGVRHALFFGMFAAVLTIIPFVGIIIGSLLPALFAFLTYGSLWYGLGVILVCSSVQFLEGNFITPNIIGTKENINPYCAILGLFAGGMLLGPIGVILSIPLLGILKIIFDGVDSLKPVGQVMGNPPREKKYQWFPKLFARKK